jgi:hypothetical protein
MTPMNNSFIGGCKSVFDEEEFHEADACWRTGQ